MVDQQQQPALGCELEVLAPDPPLPPAGIDAPAIDNLLHHMTVLAPYECRWRREIVGHDHDRYTLRPEAAHRGSRRTRRSISGAAGSTSVARSRLPAKRPCSRSSTSCSRCTLPASW